MTTLVLHVQQDNWEALEVGWMEMMVPDGAIEPVMDLLALAQERRLMPRCVPFVKEHAQVLNKAGRHADAAEMLGTAMLGGGSPGELSIDLYRAAKEAYANEAWWQSYSELAGLTDVTPDMRTAWRAFRKLLLLKENAVVLHASGWGMGRVAALDQGALEIDVHFLKGRKDRFPLRTAIDIFEVIDEDDLRVYVVRDPEQLKKMVKQEPLEVLQRLVRRYGGRANLALLKSGAAQLGLEGPSFNAWWKRARQEAEKSAWIEIAGESTKAQVRLLQAASDPATGLRKQLKQARSLAKALSRVREVLSDAKLEPELRTAALETLAELVADPAQPLAERLSSWMLLREQTQQTPAGLADLLDSALLAGQPADPVEAPALWKLFQQFPLARDQEACLEMLPVLIGEGWLDQASNNVVHAPPGMTRALIGALLEAGRGAEVARHYGNLLARPSRNPHMLITLAETVESGKAQGEVPGPLQRGQSLLHLAVFLHAEAPGDALLSRAKARLSTLLTSGKPPLLTRLLETADKGTLRSVKALVGRGVDDPIENLVTDIIVDNAPELLREGEKPFWDSEAIWTTRKGLARREGELRELKDVKLPANAEAIGKAAAHGDLSENSEWESAIEEQRNLTNRAMEIEQEVRKAQLLENAPISTDTVCPGTNVTYKDFSAGGGERHITILGPWDVGGDEVLSYRAPLAAGMLGLHGGDRARITLPSGEIEVEVVSIERASVL